MKAAILGKLNAPLEVCEDIVLPQLLPGQVLVKVEYSGVCHSQLMESKGKRGEDGYLPHLLGHEGSGVVQSVGTGVVKVKKDDKVILGWIKGSGMDAGGVKYTQNGRVVNAGAVTTFNEYAVVSENRCTPLPAGVPMDIAVLFGCALPTGAGIVMNTLKPHKDSMIAVIGLGGIGMSSLMATSLYDCSKVIAIDVNDEKLDLAKEFGATDTINASRVDVVSEVMRLTANQGVDYSVEAAGMVDTIETAFAIVKKGGGLCVFASHPETGRQISIDPYDLISGKRIQGTWGGGCDPDRDIPRMAQLYVDGKLPLERLISRRYTLDNINDALKDLDSRCVGRPLIEMSKSGQPH